MSQSLLRTLVDKALENRDTTFAEFVETGRAEGKSIRILADDLAYITGIPISWRTVYRWTG